MQLSFTSYTAWIRRVRASRDEVNSVSLADDAVYQIVYRCHTVASVETEKVIVDILLVLQR